MRALRLSVPLAVALDPGAGRSRPRPSRSKSASAGSRRRLRWCRCCSSSPASPSTTANPTRSIRCNFASSTLQITAISQGEIDIAAFGYTSFPLAIQNGGLADLRIIADEIQDGAPGYYSTPYFVRKDSGIDKIEDMKGKVAATNGLGSGVDIAMRSALNKHGLQVDARLHHDRGALPGAQGDPQGEEGRSGGRRAAVLLRSGAQRIRQAAVQHPIGHRPHRAVVLGGAQGLHRQEPRRAGRSDGGLRPRCCAGTTIRRTTRRRSRSPRASSSARRPPSSSWLFTNKDFFRDLTANPTCKVVQSSIDKVKELGFIKETLDVSKYADLTIVEEAAKRQRTEGTEPEFMC